MPGDERGLSPAFRSSFLVKPAVVPVLLALAVFSNTAGAFALSSFFICLFFIALSARTWGRGSLRNLRAGPARVVRPFAGSG
jgi:hypothetical protein